MINIAHALWCGKVSIVAAATLGGVLAAWYVFTADEWWTARIKIAPPQIQDYESYYISTAELGVGLGASNDLLRYRKPQYLFQQFITQFNSSSVKREFLLQDSDFLHWLPAESDEHTTLMTTHNWLKFIQSVADKNSDSVTLSFQSRTAELCARQLSRYTEFVSEKVRSSLLANVATIVQANIAHLQLKLDHNQRSAQRFAQLEIERYQHALSIAHAATISTPLVDQRSGDYFPIQLGEPAIKAKITALQSLSNASVLKPAISKIENELKLLTGFQSQTVSPFQPYSVVEAIAVPLTRDKPKRLLALIAGALMGGLFGCAWTLARQALQRQQPSLDRVSMSAPRTQNL